MREKLLSSDLWAAPIESIWKEVDVTFWFKAHWYLIPEETASGRQPHNLRRELYLTNDYADVEGLSLLHFLMHAHKMWLLLTNYNEKTCYPSSLRLRNSLVFS